MRIFSLNNKEIPAKMSLSQQLEYLKSLAIEALESKANKFSVVSNRIKKQIDAWNTLESDSIDVKFVQKWWDDNDQDFLNGERKWIGLAGLTIGDCDVSYVFGVAEEVDSELATLIIYRIYRIVELSGVVPEEHIESIKDRCQRIKEQHDQGEAGPAALGMQGLLGNLGGVVNSVLPAFNSLVESSKFQEVIKKSIPENADPNAPPDIKTVLNSAMSIFDSPEGKEIFNKLTSTLSQNERK